MIGIVQLFILPPGIIMGAQLLMGLAILIILHEAGHFLAARYFGIKVEKFYLFFDAWGIKLFHFKKGDTEYGIGWLPLGGYVKIAGMIDESMDKEQLALPPQPDEFRSKPAWQRLIVMLGGVIVNLVLGILIFWILNLTYGQPYVPIDEFKYGIVPGKAFSSIGIQAGDKILKVNNKEVKRVGDILSSEVLLGGAQLTIRRRDSTFNLAIPNDFPKITAKFGEEELPFTPRLIPTVDSVVKGLAGDKAGLKKGDQIIGLNQTKTEFFDQLQSELKKYKNQEITLDLLRNHNPMVLSVKLDTGGKIGFIQKSNDIVTKIEHFGFFPALAHSVPTAFGFIGSQVKAFGKIAKGDIGLNQTHGMVGIAKVYGATFDWFNFWKLTGVLSMILAFMNLLPIPALDGGHVLFLLVEIVRGKPLSDKFLETAQVVGFFIIIGLMVAVNGNDILKFFHH